MMDLFFQPLDTQFHRGSFPFQAGVDTFAPSLFPPYPRAFYGALRTEGFRKLGIDFSSGLSNEHPVLGSREKFGTLRIKGPILCQVNFSKKKFQFIFLPFPKDLIKEKDTLIIRHLAPGEKSLKEFSDLKNPEFKSLVVPAQIGNLAPFFEEVEDHYLKSGLKEYLCGTLEGNLEHFSEPSEKVFLPELKVGIKISGAQKTAQSGMLYQVYHYRLNQWEQNNPLGFYVRVEGNDDISFSQGVLKLGGEGRQAAYFPVESYPPWWEEGKEEVIRKIGENGKFKAYLITPGIFKHGSIPDICFRKNGRIFGEISWGENKFEFELIGGAIGKKIPIGGWDIQGKGPKVNRLAVPPGSVFFFQFPYWEKYENSLKKKLAKMVWEKFNFQSFCSLEPWEGDQEKGPGKEGFGIVLIGGW